MKLMPLVGILLLCLVGCASTPPAPPAMTSMADVEIRAGKGSFVFRGVGLNGTTLPESWMMHGVVLNNTGQNWNRVVFDFQLFDMTESTMNNQVDGPIRSTLHSFKDGSTQSFNTNYFRMLRGIESAQLIRKYEATFQETEFGKHRFVMIKPWESRDLLFEDQSIKILFALSEKQIGFTLHNKLNTAIKVDWITLSYVDIAGLAHGVMHTGIRYIERDRPQVPTVIPPTAMIEDVIIPSDHISYTSGSGGGWSSRPLFPAISTSDLYTGKSLSVFMPLEIDGTVKNYLFSFRIEREAM